MSGCDRSKQETFPKLSKPGSSIFSVPTVPPALRFTDLARFTEITCRVGFPRRGRNSIISWLGFANIIYVFTASTTLGGTGEFKQKNSSTRTSAMCRNTEVLPILSVCHAYSLLLFSFVDHAWYGDFGQKCWVLEKNPGGCIDDYVSDTHQLPFLPLSAPFSSGKIRKPSSLH